MAAQRDKDRSITDVFEGLQLSDTECTVALQDPCKMPQSDSNNSCDDALDISSIIVVDSDSSFVVSYIDPNDLGSLGSSSCEADSKDNILATIEGTESEAEDDRDPQTSKDSATSDSKMDTPKLSRSALKRSSYSLSDDDIQTKKRKRDVIVGADSRTPSRGLKRPSPFTLGKNFPAKKIMEDMNAVSSTPKIVTRSGRAVRMRLDKKFDYSSSQLDDEETSNEEATNSRRKIRRSSHGSSRTSTSTGSSTPMEATIIYLDLVPQVATIMYEPFANLILDDDSDLKTKIHKFLGLIPRRRKLYNPDDHLESEEPPQMEAVPSRSFLQISSLTAQPAQPMGLNASHHQSMLVNANTTEIENPDYIKAPIDLTELPSEKTRATNCRLHKGCIACLERDPLLYSFVDSLHPATALKYCHPRALSYRKNGFETCKQALAKLLFNIFNHAVFHCALQPDIVWMRSLEKPCLCEMTIDSSGQRSARLLLWQNIKHPGRLIKPLLHEMCHAAAFLFNRETGHGEACRQWVYQANQQVSEVAPIDVCHARFKYVCSMCGRGSYGLMDFAVDKEMLRCHYCQFEVVVEPWSTDNVYDCIRPDTTMTEFKTFIFDKYQQLAEQEGGTTHSTKMLCLNQQYLKMKLQSACD